MFALRGPFSVVGGALFAVIIFLGLAQLVSVPLGVPQFTIADRIVFTPQIAETTAETKREKKVTRPPPVLPPRPPRGTGATGDELVTVVRYTPPQISLPQGRGGSDLRGVDGDVLPIVRFPPDYPPRALAAGVEGWVQVRFSVTAIGTVSDAIVVASEPRAIFDKAALDAVARWRYNPRVENGTAVERVGLQTIIRFELEN
jgi:protein TonB